MMLQHASNKRGTHAATATAGEGEGGKKRSESTRGVTLCVCVCVCVFFLSFSIPSFSLLPEGQRSLIKSAAAGFLFRFREFVYPSLFLFLFFVELEYTKTFLVVERENHSLLFTSVAKSK